MAYNSAIPNASDLISSSQQQIKDNFGAIDSATFGFAVDHVTLTNATDGGKHQKVTLVNVAAPGAQTDPQSVVYTKLGTGGVYTNRSLLYFRNQNGELPVIPDLSNTTTNYGYQQGNLIYNFGRSLIPQGSSSANVTWKIPFTTAVLTVIMTTRTTGTGSSGSTKTTSADPSGLTLGVFSVYGGALSSGNLEFWYYAIGY